MLAGSSNLFRFNRAQIRASESQTQLANIKTYLTFLGPKNPWFRQQLQIPRINSTKFITHLQRYMKIRGKKWKWRK
jgi:hypothetical protein